MGATVRRLGRLPVIEPLGQNDGNDATGDENGANDADG